MLSRYGAPLEGFIDQSMMESLRTTHAAFADLDQAAGSGASPLSSIRLLLYVAESRYWMAPGTSPQVANLGLSYQDAVNRRVRAEFDKIQVVPGQSVTLKSGEGQVSVSVQNGAGYPMTVQATMSGDGVDVSGGGSQVVELAPDTNTVTYTVGMSGSRATVKVTLAAGGTVVAADEVQLRSVSAMWFIPWLAGGVVLLAVAAWLVVSRLLRRRRRPTTSSGATSPTAPS